MGFSSFRNPMPFPGITVIVGKNDTGKTGLLKLMYTLGKTNELYVRKKENAIGEPNYKKILSEKFFGVFQPRKSGLGDLVRKNANDKLSVQIKYANDSVTSLNFGDATTNSIVDVQADTAINKNINYIFIPAKEVLTAFNSIKAMSQTYFYPGFDDTYTDLIDLLNIPTQKEILEAHFEEANKHLTSMFGGELTQIDSQDRFVFRRGNIEFAMQLTAEGIKRIGILATLMKNKQLSDSTVLFMDEPETCLHPSAIREMVDMLVSLSTTGVQLFLTTHNYFILKQLHIAARREQCDILCCSLERNKAYDIDSTFANLRETFPDNSIVEESLKMYDEDVKLDLGIK